MSLPAEGYQLKGISPKAYEHPADRAAELGDSVEDAAKQLGDWLRKDRGTDDE
jgi:hypothetical protein